MQSSILFFKFILLLFFITNVQAICQNHLLSLSTINTCQNGICYFNDVISGKLDLVEGSQFCIQSQLQGENSIFFQFNITIIDTWIRYPLSDCFFSDDPQYSFSAFCGCPGGSSVSCESCPSNPPLNSSNICLSGLTTSTGCVLSGNGKFCSHFWLEGGNRFKFCSLNKGIIEVNAEFSSPSSTFNQTFLLSGQTFISGTNFNITFFSPIFTDISSQYEMLFDYLNPNVFFFSPSQNTNNFDSTDPSKLGWYRFNKSIPLQLNQFVNIYTTDCQKNQFKLSSGASNTRLWMDSHPEKNNGNLFPGSLLLDERSSQVQIPDSIDHLEPEALGQGANFLNYQGDVFGLGLNTGNTMPFSITSNKILASFDSICGPHTNIQVTCGPYIDTILKSGVLYSVQECILSQQPSCWGICSKEFNSTGNTNIVDCSLSATFPAIKWPDMIQGWWQRSSNVFILHSTETLTVNPGSEAILIPPANVLIDFSLSLDNIPITFITSSLKPVIDELESNDKEIMVWAHSEDHSGNCVFISEQDIFYSLEVLLKEEKKEYKLRPKVRNYNGFDTLILQCYKNSDMVRYPLNIRSENPNINEEGIQSNRIREASIKWSIWDKIIYGIKYPFIKLSDGFETIINFGWWALLIYFIWIISISLIFILGIYAYRRFRNRNAQTKAASNPPYRFLSAKKEK